MRQQSVTRSSSNTPARTNGSWRRRAGALALACGALAPASCQSSGSHEQWSFCVTREFYEDGSWISAIGNSPGNNGCSDSGSAVVLLAFVLLPVAIDLVILPVTGVHDVCHAR
jgi:hypothetical protein